LTEKIYFTLEDAEYAWDDDIYWWRCYLSGFSWCYQHRYHSGYSV
jgi:hypothetical protein